ncbi:MAG: GNAT family N-acetyltransferase [Bacteroidota bacterium]
MDSINSDNFSNSVPIYFTDEYIRAQNNDQIVVFKSNQFRFIVTLEGDVAYSFRQGPFGSIMNTQPTDFESFKSFQSEINRELKQKNIKKLIIRQPPTYYPSFIDSRWLKAVGYNRIISDVNQSLEVDQHPVLHKMELRKLNTAVKEGLLFSHDSISDLEEIHSFIASCREDVGLTVNITLDKLTRLFETFPSDYSLYSVRKEREILAACIVSRPIPNIYYYYLPATHPNHKSKSPMVLLIVSLMETLKSRGGEILDLGLSSINGIQQSGLYAFKKRMGAKDTSSSIYERIID